MAKKGIDVSYAQGNIDFSKVNKNEVQFAIIRSSFGWEANQKDNQFERNYANFKKLNIPVGAYHYSYATNAEEGKKEANYCYQCIKGKSFELPIYFDIEDNSVIKYGKRKLTDAVIAFCEQMKKYGYRVGVYTNPSWLNSYLYKDELIGKYNIWLAHWDVSSPAYTCGIWQYGVGGKGSVSGISGEIDLDYLMDNSLISKNTTTTNKQETSKTTTVTIFDRDKFLDMARSYIGKNGYYVCQTKLKLGAVYDWCAFAVSAIMKDCGFFGKYTEGVHSFASDEGREGDKKYGTWFLKGAKTVEPGDLIMFRYSSLNPIDKYSASHIGIVEKVNSNTITTLEGNVQGNNYNWAETSTFARCTRYLSDGSVYSFFRPNWKTTTTTSTKTSTASNTKTNSSNSQVTELGSSAVVNYSVKITSDNGVNIRAGASTTKKILGAVPYNTTLKVTKQTSGNGYTWGLITYNGVTGWIALEYTKKVETTVTFKKGDKVKVKNGAVVYGTNQKFSSFVYNTTYQIMEISGNRVVIGINGQVTSAIDKKYLTKV